MNYMPNLTETMELDDLYAVDESLFPSSGIVNPALTTMANAPRVAEHLRTRLA